MNKVFLGLIICCFSFPVLGQDTIRTNYPDSKKVWKKVYKDSKKTNDLIYWENGREWMTAKYDSADVEYWKWYHENGNPYFEATIIKDELQGIYKIWYENGQLAEEVVFLDNLENGKAHFYYPNGKLAAEGQYSIGKMVGDWEFYDEKGKPFSGNWSWKFAAADSDIRMQGIIKNHQRIGTWTYSTTAGGKKRKVFIEEF